MFILTFLNGSYYYVLGFFRDNGKENGNDYNMGYILGLHGDNGKLNGNYYNYRVEGLDYRCQPKAWPRFFVRTCLGYAVEV